MRIFISWSGGRSKYVALALRDWLPDVVQTIEPWLSSADLPSGARWAEVLERTLSESGAGIVCLTRENLNEAWLHFEAGSLAERGARVFPYLLDISPSEIVGPLALFQCTQADKNGTYRLVEAINDLSSHPLSNDRLDRAFSIHWPNLGNGLRSVPAEHAGEPTAERSLDGKIDEVLELVRDLAQTGAPYKNVPQTSPSTLDRVKPRTREPRKPRLFIASSSEGLVVAESLQVGLEKAVETTLWTQSTFDLTRTP